MLMMLGFRGAAMGQAFRGAMGHARDCGRIPESIKFSHSLCRLILLVTDPIKPRDIFIYPCNTPISLYTSYKAPMYLYVSLQNPYITMYPLQHHDLYTTNVSTPWRASLRKRSLVQLWLFSCVSWSANCLKILQAPLHKTMRILHCISTGKGPP